MSTSRSAVWTIPLLVMVACAQSRQQIHEEGKPLAPTPAARDSLPASNAGAEPASSTQDKNRLAAFVTTDGIRQPSGPGTPESQKPPELLPAPEEAAPLADVPPDEEVSANQDVTLQEVIDSVRFHFPLLRAAFASRQIASGEALSAMGAFDHKLKGESRSGPLGFYETYRNRLGFERTTMWGGQVFGGYRIGRGSFEPWYLERETNRGGEFKAGIVVPLSRNRQIDANRSELWQANIARNRVEPEIATDLIQFLRDATATYWEWVAAAENVRVAQSLLNIAGERNKGLKRQVEIGDRAEIELTDNQRLIVSREADSIDAFRKFEQVGIKLSLFLRNPDGSPRLSGVSYEQLSFPDIPPLSLRSLEDDVSLALENRPEPVVLDMTVDQLEVELSQARNLTRPEVNALLISSQDVGEPTTSKRDKSQFELEAGLIVAVPLERRKAIGKTRAIRGKLVQVTAKRQFVADKISAEVQAIRAALTAAHQRVQKAAESVRLALAMQAAEERAFELGNSNLLNLNLREKQAADAAKTLVAAQLEYFVATADYAAAVAINLSDATPSTFDEDGEYLGPKQAGNLHDLPAGVNLATPQQSASGESGGRTSAPERAQEVPDRIEPKTADASADEMRQPRSVGDVLV